VTEWRVCVRRLRRDQQQLHLPRRRLHHAGHDRYFLSDSRTFTVREIEVFVKIHTIRRRVSEAHLAGGSLLNCLFLLVEISPLWVTFNFPYRMDIEHVS
jgi:hypothetical protein